MELYDFQKRAVADLLDNELCHILTLCPGAGKTACFFNWLKVKIEEHPNADVLNDAAEDTLDKIISRQSPHAHPSPSPNRVIECLVSGEKGDTDAK